MACAALLSCALATAGYGVTNGEKVSVKGLITQRDGETLTLKTKDQGNLVVVLTDATKVEQPKGLLKVRKTEYGMTQLMLGLAVKVEGVGDPQSTPLLRVARVGVLSAGACPCFGAVQGQYERRQGSAFAFDELNPYVLLLDGSPQVNFSSLTA